jgi:hypothetical protein
MTKLEAVNAMLESVWETPVSSLEVSGVGSVAMAKRVLDKTSIIVQTRGWDFNTDTELVLTPDSSGFINLGANTLHVDADGVDRLRRVVQRGTRLYDQEDRTYVFTKSVTVKIVSYLDWDELPQAMRSYIALSAARVFKDKWEHAESPSAPTAEEVEVLRTLEENDADSRDNNMFTDSWSVASILER